MPLTAIVQNITTVTKCLPGEPQVDIVMLNYNGYAYYVEAPVGKCAVDEVVEVTNTFPDGYSIPLHLQLAS